MGGAVSGESALDVDALVAREGETADVARGILQALSTSLLLADDLCSVMTFASLRRWLETKQELMLEVMQQASFALHEVVEENNVKDGRVKILLLNYIHFITRAVAVIQEDTKHPVHEALWSTSLPEKLMDTLMRLLFLRGFTVRLDAPKKTKLDVESAQTYDDMLWEQYGTPLSYEDVSNHDNNRAVVIRALLSCFSTPLFTVGETLQHDQDPWLKYVCSKEQYTTSIRPLEVFWSLLHTILNFDTNPKSGVASIIPFAYALPNMDYRLKRIQLVNHCYALLLVLFECHSSKLEHTEHPIENKYITCLQTSLQTRDTLRLLRHLSSDLNDVIEAKRTYLQDSMLPFESYQEAVLLLWRVLEFHPDIEELLARYPADFYAFVRPLTYLMLTSSKNHSKVGLLHSAALTLFKLSGYREFCATLSTKYKYDLPTPLEFQIESAAELLVCTFRVLVGECTSSTDSILHTTLMTLLNIAPYTTKLCKGGVDALLGIFEIFAHPNYVFKSQASIGNVTCVLEAINYLLYYQFRGNAVLVSRLVKNAILFYNLDRLDVSVTPDSELSQDELVALKESLPLSPIFHAIEYVIPHMQALHKEGTLHSEERLIRLVQDLPAAGMVEQPPRIFHRRFFYTTYTVIWFSTVVWSTVFLHTLRDPDVLDAYRIRLFRYIPRDQSRRQSQHEQEQIDE